MLRRTLATSTSVGAKKLGLLTRSFSSAGKPVILDYNEVMGQSTNSQMREAIQTAYGPTGLGLLLVKNVPGFADKRQRLLPLGHRFANTPQHVRDSMVHQASFYGVGWTHGLEKFKGQPDLLKGAFKANPQYNRPTEDQDLIDKFPNNMHPNIWPKEMPELEPAFMDLGSLMVNVGQNLAKHCDAYVSSKLSSYQPGTLEKLIGGSRTCKARLLHYFPQTDETANREWCGWHNDHGALTALTSSMFMNEQGEQIPNPDARSGLYIAPRQGGTDIKMNIPADCIAYQIGESSQILTGGLLMATPHMVRGPTQSQTVRPENKGVSRTTFAVFMQPNIFESLALPAGADASQAIDTNEWVPDLKSRWQPGFDFSTFTKHTFAKYHERDGAGEN